MTSPRRNSKSGWYQLCSLDEAQPGKVVPFALPDGRLVMLLSTAKGIVVVENRCPHAGGTLDNGILREDTLTCVWHGWRFQLPSGRCLSHPPARLATIPVEIEDNNIFICLNHEGRLRKRR